MFWNTSLNDLICFDLGQHRASHDCWKLASKCQCPERLKKAAFPVPPPHPREEDSHQTFSGPACSAPSPSRAISLMP